ncbi:glycosyltransferase family 4 protein [candidate division KSB1 bacterium]|nr:glycosyltransferase family 4 protein [candidate division KSB1 bacterium]
MHILYLCYEDLRRIRGGTRHVIEIVRNFAEIGHHVTLVIPYSSPELTKSNNLEIFEISSPDLPRYGWIWYYWKSFRFIMKKWREIKDDVLYIREMLYNPFPAVLSFLFRVPLVIEVNALVNEESLLTQTRWIKRTISSLIRHFVFRKTNGVIAVSPGIKEEVHFYGFPEEKIRLISNGTDIHHFKPIPKHEARNLLNWSNEKYILGYVGSCSFYHNIPTLIEAAVLIKEEFPLLQIRIIGKGPERSIWEEMVRTLGLEEIVLFQGQISYQLVPTAISAMDIAVVIYGKSAYIDGGVYPIKLFEYLACGVPVIGTDMTGIRDILIEGSEGTCGCIVSPENPQQLAEVIHTLLEDPERRGRYGRSGRLLVERNHSWLSVAQKTTDFIKEIIKDHHQIQAIIDS